MSDESKDNNQWLNINESLVIDGDNQAFIQKDGKKDRLLEPADQASFAMTHGVYGAFIMADSKAFFFPLPAYPMNGAQASTPALFQVIDATRQACLEALKAHRHNGVVEIILVTPPSITAGEFLDPISADHSTATYRIAQMQSNPSDRMKQKVKQSLSTLGIETQWKETFTSQLQPQLGTDPVLHIKKHNGDDGDDQGGSSEGKQNAEHTWSLLYTTNTKDNGVITESVHTHKSQAKKHAPSKDQKNPK